MGSWTWRTAGADIEVRVRVTPNASRDAIEGLGEDATGLRYIKVRIRAVPEKGRANAAVEQLLAKALGASKSSVSVKSGETQRVKTLLIANGAGLSDKLEQLTGVADGG